MNEVLNKEFFERWHGRSLDHNHQLVYDATLDTTPKLRGANLVDLACGTGVFIERAINRGVSHITGVDNSCYPLDIAYRFLTDHGVSCATDVETDAQVCLLKKDARNTGLSANVYTHATFMLPSGHIQESLDPLTRQVGLEILTQESGKPSGEAEKLLNEMIANSNSPLYGRALERTYYRAFLRRNFREAHRLLVDGGYFVLAEYCGYQHVIEEKVPVEKKERIDEVTLSLGRFDSNDFPYRVVDVKFIENPKVYDDVRWANLPKEEYFPLPDTNPYMFWGVLILVAQIKKTK